MRFARKALSRILTKLSVLFWVAPVGCMARIASRVSRTVHSKLPRSFLLFLPGMLLLSLGVLLVVAPRFVLAFVAISLVLLGLMLCYAGWLAAQLFYRVTGIVRTFEGRVVLQGVNLKNFVQPQEARTEDGDASADKKIIYH